MQMAAVVNKVTCNLPLQGAPCVTELPCVKELPLLKDLYLADPTFHLPGRIDLLLGGDILPQILLPNAKTGPRNTPTAWKTIFGWVILGPFQASNHGLDNYIRMGHSRTLPGIQPRTHICYFFLQSVNSD